MNLPTGKASSQIGHAFQYSLEDAKLIDPDRYQRYVEQDNAGSKVTLAAKDQRDLIKALGQALELGLPCSEVIDEHHIFPPHFDGAPILSALGIGPCTKAEAKKIVRKFKLL